MAVFHLGEENIPIVLLCVPHGLQENNTIVQELLQSEIGDSYQGFYISESDEHYEIIASKKEFLTEEFLLSIFSDSNLFDLFLQLYGGNTELDSVDRFPSGAVPPPVTTLLSELSSETGKSVNAAGPPPAIPPPRFILQEF